MKTNKALTGAVTKIDGDRYRIIASTDDIDRDGERILPSAFKDSLPKFLKDNPVILGFHNYYDFPIGKAVDGRISEHRLELDIQFAETDRGREAKYLYDNGFMSSFSVGFIPKDWRNDPDGVREFTSAELLEVSAVPVPANAAANIIRDAEAAGATVKFFKEAVEEKRTKPMPTPTGDESEDAFLERCMENPTMISDFPDDDQRFAVCNEQWENRSAKGNDVDNIAKSVYAILYGTRTGANQAGNPSGDDGELYRSKLRRLYGRR